MDISSTRQNYTFSELLSSVKGNDQESNMHTNVTQRLIG